MCVYETPIVDIDGTCPLGTYFDKTECKECPRGKYQDQTGQTSCKQCNVELTVSIPIPAYVTTTATINSGTSANGGYTNYVIPAFGVAVTQVNGYMTWTMTIDSAGITEVQDVAVTQASGGTGTLTTALQNEYTIGIDSTTFVAAAQGATVTQGAITGALKSMLSGSQTEVVVVCASGVVFDNSTALTIDDNGTSVVVAQSAIGSVAHSGATTTVTITSAIGQIFDAAGDLVIGTTVLATAVTNAASVTVPNAVGTLKTALTGASTTDASTTEVVITSAEGSTAFNDVTDLILDGTTILFLTRVHMFFIDMSIPDVYP